MEKGKFAFARAQTIHTQQSHQLDDNSNFNKEREDKAHSLNNSLVVQPVQKASCSKLEDASPHATTQQHMQHLRFTRRLNKMWKSNRNFREKLPMPRVDSDGSRRSLSQRVIIQPTGSKNATSIGNITAEARRNSRLKTPTIMQYTPQGVLVGQSEKSEDASLSQLFGNVTEFQLVAKEEEEGPVAAIQLEPEEEQPKQEEQVSFQQDEPAQYVDGRPMFLRSTTQTAFLVMDGSDKENAMKLRELKDYKGCIVLPDDGWFVVWSIFLIVMIIFSGIFTPLRVAFLNEDPLSSGIQWFLDVVFFTDTVLSFVTAYFDRGESLVDNRRAIACNYLRSWFFVDIVSVLPLKIFFRHSISQMGKIARVHRVDRIIRTFK